MSSTTAEYQLAVGGKLNYLKKAYARMLEQEGVYVVLCIVTVACIADDGLLCGYVGVDLLDVCLPRSVCTTLTSGA